eukprot:TRINITY_DN13524_c2_g1_i1.p1 TRINITY_DN13524_c2_g1~~TRINITY_DN13524_c2_g1_i1.p1  ORF type:complete len:643 (+),score=188.76 TRINITY_DN13524_c2_g1_i1:119-2047(+)
MTTPSAQPRCAQPEKAVPSRPAPQVFRPGENEIEWSVFWLRMAEVSGLAVQAFNEKYSELFDLVRYLIQCEGRQLNRPSVTVKREELNAFLHFFPLEALMDDVMWLNSRRFFLIGAHTKGVEEELKKRRKRGPVYDNGIYYHGADDDGGGDGEGIYKVGDFLVRPSHSRPGQFAVTYLVQEASPRHTLVTPTSSSEPLCGGRRDFLFTPLNGYKPVPPADRTGFNYSFRNYLELLCNDVSQTQFTQGCGVSVGSARPSPLLAASRPPAVLERQSTHESRASTHSDPYTPIGSARGTAGMGATPGKQGGSVHSMSFTSNGFMDSVDATAGLHRNDTSRSGDVLDGMVEDATGQRLSHNVKMLMDQCLGRGSFGQVFKAVDTVTNEFLAVKRIFGLTNEKMDKINREIGIMAKLSHPNIVRYHGSIFNKQVLCLEIYMELMHEELNVTIRRIHFDVQGKSPDEARPVLEREVRHTGRQVIAGLRYLHEKGVVHRDIKPANILVSTAGEVKLSDFGTAKSYENSGMTQDTAQPVGTFAFMAPEVLLRTYTGSDKKTFEARKQTDIWSLGCTLLMAYTGRLPWCEVGDDVLRLIRYIDEDKEGTCRPAIPDDVPAPLRDLLAMTLNRIPDSRPTADAMLRSPFFAA